MMTLTNWGECFDDNEVTSIFSKCEVCGLIIKEHFLVIQKPINNELMPGTSTSYYKDSMICHPECYDGLIK